MVQGFSMVAGPSFEISLSKVEFQKKTRRFKTITSENVHMKRH